MKFDILTIFPEAFNSYFNSSMMLRARKKKLLDIRVHDLREWTRDKHKTVDDRPYGGGPGMVLKVEPIYKAVEELKKKSKIKPRVILLSAKGKLFDQAMARKLSKKKNIILICGHYEGVDERVAKYIADEEISIGEYVLTGGELPAMILVDAIGRLVPGVVGKKMSIVEESFFEPNFKEYPQYTRPEVIGQKKKGKSWVVPKVLLSGDHAEIEKWRKLNSKRAQR